MDVNKDVLQEELVNKDFLQEKLVELSLELKSFKENVNCPDTVKNEIKQVELSLEKIADFLIVEDKTMDKDMVNNFFITFSFLKDAVQVMMVFYEFAFSCKAQQSETSDHLNCPD